MNRDFINTYMQEKSIPTGYLKSWYNFESGVSTGSAGLIYNQVYTTDQHYYDTSNYDGSLKSGVLAGISIGDNDVISSNGLFDYREMVQISDKVDYNNWTVFLDFTTSNQQNLTNQNKIILSSMQNSGDSSGFYVGLNGYNHPFITYASTDGHKYTHTFDREASNRNLFSFSLNGDGKSLSIEKHSPLEDYKQSYNTKQVNFSNVWTLGGFKDHLNTLEPSNEMRNFDGIINHFMLFNPSLKGNSTNNFSDFLFIKNYEEEQIKQTAVETVNNSTGAFITSGVIGTGITGYEKTLVDTIDGIEVYMNSGVAGEISGDVISYSETSDTITSFVKYLADEVKTFDDTVSLNFFDKKISFLKNVESGFELPQSGSLYVDNTRQAIQKRSISGYEVATSQKVLTNTQKIATWNNTSGSFVLGTGISDKNINLFRNGLLQRSGTLSEVNSTDTDGTGFADYVVLDSRYVYSNNRYDENDYLMYEECDLPNVIGAYTKGQESYFFHPVATSTNDYISVQNSFFVNKDLYFGGLKLMSGVDYERFASDVIFIHTNNLNHGIFSWVEKFTSVDANSETGNLDQVLSLNNKLMDEVVWLSGIRQTRDVDYIKTADFSVLNSGYNFDLTQNTHIIYSGESGNFNL